MDAGTGVGSAVHAAAAAEIEWVRRNSPMLDRYVRRVLGDGSLAGVRVAVALHLDMKTAFLATVLQDAGAEVAACGSNPRTTSDEAVALLRARGVLAVGAQRESRASWTRGLREIVRWNPEIVLDDGAELVVLMAAEHPERLAALRGVCEKTTTGTDRIRAMERDGRVGLPPTLTVDDARCKHLFDNRHASGQTTWQAIAHLSACGIAGSVVVVLGYGWVGRGLADYARGLGARVRVIEVDPVRALEAHAAGLEVGDHAHCLPGAAVVVTATGARGVIGPGHRDLLDDGVVLANAGHSDDEIDVAGFAEVGRFERVSRDVEVVVLPDRTLTVLCGGALVNVSGGSGNYAEAIDLTFAVQVLGARLLARGDVPPGRQDLPAEVDTVLAREKLALLGVTLPAGAGP